MKKNAYILLIAFTLFFACKQVKVQNVDLKKPIDAQILTMRNNNKSDSLKLDLCSFIPLKWDSLVVVTGYTTSKTLKAFNFENQNVVGQFIDMVPENSIILLYIKSNNIVGYSDLPSPLLDFGRISYHRKLGFTIMHENECDNLLIRKYIKNGKTYFKFDNQL
ncbi:hypothetical protein EV200_11189 [Pedobacter psychrotolerans]|uniref:Lipoprotein n=1 Tax=Pedobacter psychrotolerans TaxID=1843235 RepID=A0A4R2H2C9_9SPHI|nr:hypothetical protein [Pedobacter psychrotolerans]TCO18751.1 hypothetical protein EV200_11189 [Pedobacter psychrotolerans]GGE70468.1 hypothetical protein GCM10011413_41460 [Pedobacter psychrotolerans]